MKNTDERMGKDLLINSALISSTHAFQQDVLRHEITKIPGRKCLFHLQGGNYEFKIAVWNKYRKIFEKNIYKRDKQKCNKKN